MALDEIKARDGNAPKAGRGRRPATLAPVDGQYDLDAQVGFLIRRAQQRHIAIFQRIMGDDGPTPTQFAALAKLLAEGAISQNLLGRMTAMDPATIKGVIARLEERGLVERVPDPDDQRRVRVSLTAHGRDAVPPMIEKAKSISAAT